MRFRRRAAALALAAALLAACAQEPSARTSRAVPAPEPTATTTEAGTETPTEAAGRTHEHRAHDGAADREVPAPSEEALAGHGSAGDPALPTGEELIAAVRGDAARWEDVGAAQAAGYRSIGDAFTGYEHLVHPGRAADPSILDPSAPESLVYRVEGGTKTYVSAMFILPPDATLADVPDLGDERAVWHIHDDLCFDEEGRLAGVFRDGSCLFGGEHRVTPPMLHVWVIEHPCGPFAGIEGHGGRCEDHAGH